MTVEKFWNDCRETRFSTVISTVISPQTPLGLRLDCWALLNDCRETRFSTVISPQTPLGLRLDCWALLPLY